jgi:hypothetical protein
MVQANFRVTPRRYDLHTIDRIEIAYPFDQRSQRVT